MRRHRALLVVACALCLIASLGGEREARAAGSLRSIPAPAGMLGLGCMSQTVCVVGGDRGLHHVAHVQILRNGQVTQTIMFSGRGDLVGQGSISCPSARECLVVVDEGAAGSELFTVGADGQIGRPRALPRTHGAKFDEISCASTTRCELAGEWDIGGDDPVVAWWNGSRTGRVYALQTPADRNLVYSGDADLSCGGDRCEVSYTFSSSPNRAVRLSTITNGGAPRPVLLPYVHALSVACAANGACYGALNSPNLFNRSRIARIVNGRLSDTRPLLHLEDTALACQVTSCLAVGFGANDGQLVSITDGRVQTPLTVRTISLYQSVTDIPGGGFVAFGYGHSDTPLLTFISGR